MDTQYLQAFIEVVETGSFSVAAERLHLTQPAISKRIATLEQQLNCRLFDRIGRTIKLTESGNALLPRAEQILLSVAETKRAITDLQGAISGTLSIGISHHIGLHRLPPVLQSFSKRYPEVHLDIDFMDSEEANEQILHGRIELAVITLDPEGAAPLGREPVWTDELVVCVAPDHPLAGHDLINLETLGQFHAIMPGPNTYTGQIVKALFQRHSVALDVSMSTNYLETIKMMVSIGLGWSVLPRTMVDEQMVILTLNEVSLERTLGYVYHRNRSLSNAASAFVNALQKNADK